MRIERRQESRQNQAMHAAALAWRGSVATQHSIAWLQAEADRFETRAARAEGDLAAARLAIRELFAGYGFPADCSDEEILFLRDPLGRPFASWGGEAADWASERRVDGGFHISNTNDGGAHIVVAAYAPDLVGLGVDAVALDRLRSPGKGKDYLLRFCRQFMGEDEWLAFAHNSDEDGDEAVRLRAAAHFSLMESASKACGTGLRIGAGMGKPTSLPKHSLGVRRLAPNVELIFSEEAEDRLKKLGAVRYEAHWAADYEFLVSAVLLFNSVS